MPLLCLTSDFSAVSWLIFTRQSLFGPHIDIPLAYKILGQSLYLRWSSIEKSTAMFTSGYSAQCKKRWPKSLRATLYVTAAKPRFQSFFGGRFFSQNWHFGITKRITKHNFLVLQSTYLCFMSNEDHTFEKKNVSFLLVTSTLRDILPIIW